MLFSNNNHPANKNKINYWHRPKKSIKIPCIRFILLQNFLKVNRPFPFQSAAMKKAHF